MTHPDMGGQLPPGTVLDKRYRIVSLIKAGGMGAVYRAEDTLQGGKVCAIKEMLDKSETAEEKHQAVDRFLAEVQVLARLSHPSIPRVLDSFLEKSSFYFVMEFIEGHDLATILEERGSPGLEQDEVVGWSIQVVSALEYLHSLSPPIVHRDLKPSNLLRRASDGRILIIDFGIARATNPMKEFWIGTPGYAPPEQHANQHEPKSDLYALGATMHELLTGVTPSGFEFPGFHECGLDIPSKLEECIGWALATFPEDRITSAGEMRARLEDILGYSTVAHDAAAFGFSTACQDVKKNVIDPLLKQLSTRYRNECMTPFWPPQLEYVVFTLGLATPFELIIKRNDGDERIEFFEKQGILSQLQLGRIDPRDAAEIQQIQAIFDKFCTDYDESKFAF
jgi:serine/threonine protein kinase